MGQGWSARHRHKARPKPLDRPPQRILKRSRGRLVRPGRRQDKAKALGAGQRVRQQQWFRRRSAEAQLAANDFAYVDELVRRWSPVWDVPPGETAAVKEVLRQPGCAAAALGYYRAVKFPPPASLRHRIRVPAAVFAGTDDRLVLIGDYEHSRRFYLAGCEIVKMPGGHFMHREHPARFNAELLRLLESNFKQSK